MVHARDDGSTGEGGGVGADEGEGAPSSDGPGLKPDRLALRIDSPIVIRFAIWTEIESLSVESIRIDSRL